MGYYLMQLLNSIFQKSIFSITILITLHHPYKYQKLPTPIILPRHSICTNTSTLTYVSSSSYTHRIF